MKKAGTNMQKEKKSNDDLRQDLVKRIKELSQEVKNLIEKKQKHQQITKEIDLRITQLVGALSELERFTKAEDDQEHQLEHQQDSSSQNKKAQE